jgi:hypothetical protein
MRHDLDHLNFLSNLVCVRKNTNPQISHAVHFSIAEFRLFKYRVVMCSDVYKYGVVMCSDVCKYGVVMCSDVYKHRVVMCSDVYKYGVVMCGDV